MAYNINEEKSDVRFVVDGDDVAIKLSESASGGSGNSPYIIKEEDTTSFADENVLSSKRTVKEITSRSISKVGDDSVQGHITFNGGITVSDAEIENGLLVKGKTSFKDAIDGISAVFSGLMKATEITCLGLLTTQTINAENLNIQNFSADKIYVNYLNVNNDIKILGDIYNPNYISQTTAWKIGANGYADFRNLYVDELHAQAFTADVAQALAGSDYLTKSVSKLSANFVIPSPVGSSARLIVDDLEGIPATQCFVNNDYIRLRAFNRTSGLTIANVWGTVTLDTTFGTNGFLNGTQAYTFTVTSLGNGSGLTVFKGSEVLDYGRSGSGIIIRTTLDEAGSPYEQISTWATNPGNSANYTVHARLGNLAGIPNCNGYGLYSDNVFLTKSIVIGDLTKTNNYLSFDTVNGLVIKLAGSDVATAISSKVSSTDYNGNTIASKINQSSTTIAISAQHIDISGAVSFDSLNADAQNRLDNNLVYNNLGTQLLPNDWIIGTGGTANYIQLGLTSENSRILGLNHLGKNSIMWQCAPSGAGDYDGGWSTASKTIDKTKTYRFSVIVKKTLVNGTFYFGCGNNSVCNLNTATKSSSPFFLSDTLSNHLGKWLLITGYIYPYGYTGLTNGSEVYNCETGEKITDINTLSFNWATDSADVVNRCYLFGDTETTNRCYMYNPRLDLVDGKEPSIVDIIGINAVQAYSSKLTLDAKNALAVGLGYASYDALNTEALAGRTVIVGGKINTNLLEANVILANALSAGTITAGTAIIDGLKATNIDVTGKITATLGKVGAFAIDSYQLAATNGNDSLILNADLIRFTQTNNSAVYIGGNTISASTGGTLLCPQRIEVTRPQGYFLAQGNVGISLNITGCNSYDDTGYQVTGNHALWIEKGDICGSRFRQRRISASQTLSKMDSFIITINNSSTITLTLPYGCEDGQWFLLKSNHFTSGNFIIQVESGHGTQMYWTGNSGTSITINDGKDYLVRYDSVNNEWALGISNF